MDDIGGREHLHHCAATEVGATLAVIPALPVHVISRPGALLRRRSDCHFAAISFWLQPLFNRGLRLKIAQVNNRPKSNLCPYQTGLYVKSYMLSEAVKLAALPASCLPAKSHSGRSSPCTPSSRCPRSSSQGRRSSSRAFARDPFATSGRRCRGCL